MRVVRWQLLPLVLSGCLSALAHAAPDCAWASDAVMYTKDIGPQHHPIGRPLPQNAEFNQPASCGDGVWFFDLNHNGRPDPGEPRLFGSRRVIGCGSCHGTSPDAKTETAASVFLRQDVGVLCLICHRL